MALATSSFAYPAFIEPNGEGGFIASFRDIPEALTEGLSPNEVLDLAADALLTALEFYVESERAVPSPSVPKAGEVLVEVPPSAAAKVLLLNAMVESGVRPRSSPVSWASAVRKCIASRTCGMRRKSTALPKRCARSGTALSFRSRRRDSGSATFGSARVRSGAFDSGSTLRSVKRPSPVVV